MQDSVPAEPSVQTCEQKPHKKVLSWEPIVWWNIGLSKLIGVTAHRGNKVSALAFLLRHITTPVRYLKMSHSVKKNKFL